MQEIFIELYVITTVYIREELPLPGSIYLYSSLQHKKETKCQNLELLQCYSVATPQTDETRWRNITNWRVTY